MKKPTKILSAFFILLLCLSLVACGGADKSGDPAAKESARPDNGIGKTFKTDNATIEVTEITDDLTEVSNFIKKKSENGKYVAVVLTITDGKLDADKLEESVTGVKLDGCTFADAIAQGVTIENNKAYANRQIYVIYDVPEDYDLSDSVATVPE